MYWPVAPQNLHVKQQAAALNPVSPHVLPTCSTDESWLHNHGLLLLPLAYNIHAQKACYDDIHDGALLNGSQIWTEKQSIWIDHMYPPFLCNDLCIPQQISKRICLLQQINGNFLLRGFEWSLHRLAGSPLRPIFPYLTTKCTWSGSRYSPRGIPLLLSRPMQLAIVLFSPGN